MSVKNKIAVYPGTFDPVTFGHIDIIERASGLFDTVIVSPVKRASKNTLFSVEERVRMIKQAVREIKNVSVECFDGLLADYANAKKASAIIRGVRSAQDFENEFRMALTNRKIGRGIETVFLMPDEKYSYISSTLVREIASHKGDLSLFVPENAASMLKAKFT